MQKETVSTIAMACIMVISQSVALLLAPFFIVTGAYAFPDPDDPVNPLIYIILILVFTAVILGIVKLRKQNVVKYIILGSMALAMVIVYFIPFYVLLYDTDPGGTIAFLLSVVTSAGLTFALIKKPEWYVVDAVGISVAAGVTAILGISFTILPAILLLIGLAVYDAISVYKTKHMVTLADAVAGERLPVLLVIPKSKKYSFMKQKGLKEQIASGEEREAMFMGLGDMIIPGTLVVSALASNVDKLSVMVIGITGPVLVAVGTLIGGLLGFLVLMRFVLKGNPQAGLPLLNSGVILGYLVTYYLIFQDLSFGIRF